MFESKSKGLKGDHRARHHEQSKGGKDYRDSLVIFKSPDRRRLEVNWRAGSPFSTVGSRQARRIKLDH